MAKKSSTKKKGPKGKKARAQAKLEKRWGEHVDEEALQKSKIRRGKSRLKSKQSNEPRLQVTAAQITTAAELSGAALEKQQPVSPNVFTQGMAVAHPTHGLGKIVALSGSGKNRRATVRFATAGEKRFVLAHSPLRPAGK